MRNTVQGKKKPSDQLNICLLSYRGNPTCGGQGVYIKRISKALQDLGHHIEVITGPPYPDLDEGIVLHRLQNLDLYNPNDLFRTPSLHELRSPANLLEWLGVSSGGFPEPFTFGLRAYNFFKSKKIHYDIVHDNQCLAYGIWGIRSLGFPLVATIHHPITVDKEVEFKAARNIIKKLQVLRWYSFIRMQKQVSRRLSHIITVSEVSKTDIAEQFRIPDQRFRVVPNGINTDIFHPLSGVERKKNHIMVTNSADTPLKGLPYLLKAVAALKKKRDIKLTVIGKPKENGHVASLVRNLGIADVVRFTGRISDEDFAAYYAKTTIAVVPSIYEGFGLPAGEAMACGVPVISTTGGALPEVVGDAGILVAPGDSHALEEAIVALLDNPDKCGELGKAGYERVQKNFTWQKAAERTVDVYREAMSVYN
jgi:glycosyltransferase involved in cell wall biosynthesis